MWDCSGRRHQMPSQSVKKSSNQEHVMNYTPKTWIPSHLKDKCPWWGYMLTQILCHQTGHHCSCTLLRMFQSLCQGSSSHQGCHRSRQSGPRGHSRGRLAQPSHKSRSWNFQRGLTRCCRHWWCHCQRNRTERGCKRIDPLERMWQGLCTVCTSLPDTVKTSRIDLTLTRLESINCAPTLSLSNSWTVGGFGPHAPSVISAFTAERNKANIAKDFIFALDFDAERLCTTDR